MWPFSRRRRFDCSDGKDERNWDYPVSAILTDLTNENLHPVSRYWECPEVLNQGSEGACVGFSIAHELIANPVAISGIGPATARMIYTQAQFLDEWPGENYSGTSINAGMKVVKKIGYISEYRWAFGIDDLVLSVGHLGPAVLGIDWYEGMARLRRGRIAPTGRKTGRHAILCNGYNRETQTFTLHNSWGKRWGKRGECEIHRHDLGWLLGEGGLAAIPLIREIQD